MVRSRHGQNQQRAVVKNSRAIVIGLVRRFNFLLTMARSVISNFVLSLVWSQENDRIAPEPTGFCPRIPDPHGEKCPELIEVDFKWILRCLL